jgi:hypothetical protein
MTTFKKCHQLTALILAASCLTFLSSCSENTKSTANNKAADKLEELTIEGRYHALLKPLNTAVGGFPTGKVNIQVMADNINIRIKMKDTPPNTMHSQFIFSADECPTYVHDSNDDGYVDPFEASKVMGSILIPLDADLDSQISGIEIFPIADNLGGYEYFNEGSLSKMEADLKSPDDIMTDEIIKLDPQSDFKLEGKVVVIQGIHKDAYLPGSVRGVGMSSERTSLTIACGKLQRVKLDETQTVDSDATVASEPRDTIGR